MGGCAYRRGQAEVKEFEERNETFRDTVRHFVAVPLLYL